MAESAKKVFHIIFVRHGESVGNAEDRMQGLKDYPLSETGHRQAQALAARWKTEGIGFDTIITSPLGRARTTAEILARGVGVHSVEMEFLWAERDMGKRAGLTMAEIRAQFPLPEFTNPYYSDDGEGESDWDLFLRAGQALNTLLKRDPGRYLVVTHGAILNMTLHAIFGITPHANYQGVHFSLGNTAFCSFRYYPDSHRWRVDAINDRGHWRDEAA